MSQNKKLELNGQRKHKTRDNILTIAALVVIGVLLILAKNGQLFDEYIVRVLNLCAIYSIVALSMNLVNGFTGLFSLGQAGFMAVGAYVTTLLFMSTEAKETLFYLDPIAPWLGSIQLPFLVALVIGGLVSALFAFLIGFPVLRLRGDYLAIATLGFSEIIRVIFTNTQSITNGSIGLKNIPPDATIITTFVVMILVIAFFVRLMKTSYGRALKAIREDEIAAESMGISLFKHKMISFILSGFIAGIGGGLLASVVGAITPLQFRFLLAYEILLIVVLGGQGSISGSVVGAFLITIAKEWLRWLDNGFSIFGIVEVPPIAGLRMVVFSVLLMIIILFYSKGLFGNKEFSWQAMFNMVGSIPRRVAKLFSKKDKGGAVK